MRIPQILLLVFYFLPGASLFSQKDSSGWKFAGFQADVSNGIFILPASPDQQKLQTFVSNDQYLYLSLNTFTPEIHNYMVYENYFQGIAGGKAFFKNKAFGSKSEVFIGLRYSGAIVTISHYSKTVLDTLSISSNPPNSTKFYQIRKTNDNYNFHIWGRRVFLPIGINFSSRQDRFLWFTAGIEMSPFICFDHRFVSGHYTSSYETGVEAGKEPGLEGDNRKSEYNATKQNVKGLGIGLYAGIPVSAYFHPFRNPTSGLRHLNLYLTAMPLFAAASTRFSPPASRAQITFGAGLRLNFSN